MKNTCPFHIAFQDLKIKKSYKFYKIKPPVLLFAIVCVTLEYPVLLQNFRMTD